MFLIRALLFALFFAMPVTVHADSRSYGFLLAGLHISPIDFRLSGGRAIEHNINDGSLHIGSGIALLARPAHKPGANFSIAIEGEVGYLFGKREITYNTAPDRSTRAEVSTGLDVAAILRLNWHTGPVTSYVKGGGGGTSIQREEETINDTKFTSNSRVGGGVEFDIGTRNIKARLDYTFIKYNNIERFRGIDIIGDRGETHLIRAGFVQMF
ncbi:MAG: hypothetical protein GDA50_03980 [Alphaproteobacteria bacterium GM202ARS2]|nr:hypothetical protein [Alphaproteobacteria bacterium GM202ARS2]